MTKYSKQVIDEAIQILDICFCNEQTTWMVEPDWTLARELAHNMFICVPNETHRSDIWPHYGDIWPHYGEAAQLLR